MGGPHNLKELANQVDGRNPGWGSLIVGTMIDLKMLGRGKSKEIRGQRSACRMLHWGDGPQKKMEVSRALGGGGSRSGCFSQRDFNVKKRVVRKNLKPWLSLD